MGFKLLLAPWKFFVHSDVLGPFSGFEELVDSGENATNSSTDEEVRAASDLPGDRVNLLLCLNDFSSRHLWIGQLNGYHIR